MLGRNNALFRDNVQAAILNAPGGLGPGSTKAQDSNPMNGHSHSSKTTETGTATSTTGPGTAGQTKISAGAALEDRIGFVTGLGVFVGLVIGVLG